MMSYLNADHWQTRYSTGEELTPPGFLAGLDRAAMPAGGATPSRWLLELMDEEDRSLRVLIVDGGDGWSEGDDE